ncbi:MAG: hypothetical protein NTW78_04650 [Campylobacterales bacterium]|nr:hypothetical protein [Campylobacterales bacterium]
MRVVSLINSNMICETSSIYALHYAKAFTLKLSLVHIKENDKLSIIDKVFADIKKLAASLDVEVELIIYESFKELEQLILDKNIDILFCSTKHERPLFEQSFAKRVIQLGLRVDLAVVKVVKFAGAMSIEKIIMPIRGHQLSVKKFTFFTAFVNAYTATAEIFSVDEIKQHPAAWLDAKAVKIKLQEVTFHLRHYFKLAVMMKMKFSLRHSYALIEGDELQSHIARNSFDLAIVGGHHKKSIFHHHPIEALFEKPMINTIYFIPFNDDV